MNNKKGLQTRCFVTTKRIATNKNVLEDNNNNKYLFSLSKHFYEWKIRMISISMLEIWTRVQNKCQHSNSHRI